MAPQIGHVGEGDSIEELLLEVGVEDFAQAVELRRGRDELVHAVLFEEAREAARALPGPEGRAAVAHHRLGPTVPLHGSLERGDHGVGALGVVERPAGDEAGVVVDEREHEHLLPVDVLVDEVHVPQLVGPQGLIRTRVVTTLDLGGPIAGVLHDTTHRLHGHLGAGAPELVTFWQDPDFNAAQNAFYYVRVLEIPTPTWPVYDALKFRLTLPAEVIKIQQERAYSSPIWYTPSA